MSEKGRKTLFVTALTDTKTTDVEGIGTERFDQYGNKYIWVYNASAIAARAGGPACYDASLYSSENFRRHVLVDTADDDTNFFAGVFMSAIPTLNYGWILAEGRYAGIRIAQASASSMALGDLLIPSTLTATNATGVAKAFAFIAGYTLAAAWTGNTGAGFLSGLMNQNVKLLAAVASAAASSTAAQEGTVFVKGL